MCDKNVPFPYPAVSCLGRIDRRSTARRLALEHDSCRCADILQKLARLNVSGALGFDVFQVWNLASRQRQVVMPEQHPLLEDQPEGKVRRGIAQLEGIQNLYLISINRDGEGAENLPGRARG